MQTVNKSANTIEEGFEFLKEAAIQDYKEFINNENMIKEYKPFVHVEVKERILQKQGISSNDVEDYLTSMMNTDRRASLVPAAAVIPAPIVYIKVVVVKMLVV